MFTKFGALCLLLQVTLGPAQLITLRDGKIGVNFAGYHADAGLGGLLTGNPAHGGLSASASTPWGARTAAGLGGSLDGRTAGGAYAAAQANDEVGASAVLDGSVGERGYIGAEAHRPGKTSGSSAQITSHHMTSAPVPRDDQPAVLPTRTTYVQRVNPPKKYSLIAPSRSSAKTVTTSMTYSQRPQIQQQVIATQAQGNVVGSALDIPIGILRSLQVSLGNLAGGGVQPAVAQAAIVPYQGPSKCNCISR